MPEFAAVEEALGQRVCLALGAPARQWKALLAAEEAAHVRTHARTHTHTHTHTHKHKHTRTRAHAHTHIRICKYTYESMNPTARMAS